MYIDTHAHLTDENFTDRLGEVVFGWREANVGQVITVGYDVKSSKESAYIAEKYGEVFFTAGLHPSDGEQADSNTLEEIYNLTKHPKCVAIGEIGLDYHYGEDRELQKKTFVAQMELAKEIGIAVTIHARDCTQDMLSIVERYKDSLPAIVLHCYSLGAESAKTFLKYGCHFAFGGAITFKNNKQIYEVAKVLPKDRLLTETDCPYMTPVPYRGKVNEPKYVGLVCDKLSELYGVDTLEMQKVLEENTLRVFKRRR